MVKVVVNRCYGGFGLSDLALKRLENTEQLYSFREPSTRTDTLLVQVVEELGILSHGRFASLEVVEVPDDVKWYIDEYDGFETIRECHRSW